MITLLYHKFIYRKLKVLWPSSKEKVCMCCKLWQHNLYIKKKKHSEASIILVLLELLVSTIIKFMCCGSVHVLNTNEGKRFRNAFGVNELGLNFFIVSPGTFQNKITPMLFSSIIPTV